jgi:hypothetical protein
VVLPLLHLGVFIVCSTFAFINRYRQQQSRAIEEGYKPLNPPNCSPLPQSLNVRVVIPHYLFFIARNTAIRDPRVVTSLPIYIYILARCSYYYYGSICCSEHSMTRIPACGCGCCNEERISPSSIRMFFLDQK